MASLLISRAYISQNFDHCTQPLGPLRQSVFSCLTCNPPPASPLDSYNPAGVCYSCSIACHGQHTLVELFNRRDFTCDCGTTRLPSTAPCTLRLDPITGVKGLVHSQPAAQSNTYNQNFRNRFCGCGELYDPHKQKGTMFQCLGLETEQNGGCGEDWYHPECLLGLPRNWHVLKHEDTIDQKGLRGDGSDNVLQQAGEEEADHPIPPGFPEEDQIESVICYKCTAINPWIKRYAGTKGFLPPVYHQSVPQSEIKVEPHSQSPTAPPNSETLHGSESNAEPLEKRKAESDETDCEPTAIKKLKTESVHQSQMESVIYHDCRKTTLPKPSTGSFSLIASDENFRTEFCRCAECYKSLRKYPQLLEEEDVYEPPLSDEGDGEGDVSVGTGSLLERGEAALSNIDRVRAIGTRSMSTDPSALFH